MADVYGLADKDNDKTLYKSFGELDELWDIIDVEIENITNDLEKKKAKTCMEDS